MKLGELMLAKDALKKILSSNLPIKNAYELSKMTDTFFEEVGHIDNFRSKLLEKYGTPVADGNIHIKPECKDDFLSEYNELLDQEYTGEVIQTHINTLLDTNVELTPIELKILIEVGLVVEE